MSKATDVAELVGKTCVNVSIACKGSYLLDDWITFLCSDGSSYEMFHKEDCCESVNIEDIIGDLYDLVGSPILMAEEATNSTDNPKREPGPYNDYESYSFTWTFYKFRTLKGDVTIRWYGSSSGYYSERVNFARVDEES